MSNYFRIWGYFSDDSSPINAIVCESHDCPDSDEENNIFFYGLSEDNIKEAISKKELVGGEFYITSYEKFTV